MASVKTPKACEVCQKSYIPFRRTQRFCGIVCRALHDARQKREPSLNRKEKPPPRTLRTGQIADTHHPGWLMLTKDLLRNIDPDTGEVRVPLPPCLTWDCTCGSRIPKGGYCRCGQTEPLPLERRD